MIFEAPEEADWKDEKVWKKANPALGAFRKVDEMRRLCQQAQETPALEMTFRRLYLNQWVNSVERWLPMDKWDDCDEKVGELRPKPCYAGLDLSSTTDLTALALVFPAEDGSYDVPGVTGYPRTPPLKKSAKTACPTGNGPGKGLITMTPGNIIDYGYVLKQITQDMADYDLRELAFDRWGSQKLTTDLQEMGFSAEPESAGRPLGGLRAGIRLDVIADQRADDVGTREEDPARRQPGFPLVCRQHGGGH